MIFNQIICLIILLVIIIIYNYYININNSTTKLKGGNIKTLYKINLVSDKSYPIKKFEEQQSSPISTNAPIVTQMPLNKCNLSIDEKKNYEENYIYNLYTKKIENIDISICDIILLKNQLDLNFNGLYKVIKIQSEYVQLIKLIDMNNITKRNAIKFLNFYKNNSLPLLRLSYFNNSLYYKPTHTVIINNFYKSDKDYIFKNIKSVKNWYDSSKNYINAKIINGILYNQTNNNIFTFNNNKYLNINVTKTDKIKSIILVLHIIDEKINIIDSLNKICNIKLINKTTLVSGINKLVLNNEEIAVGSNFFNKVYDKPVILYIEFKYHTNNLYINKYIDYNSKCNGYIYEIIFFSKKLEVNNYKEHIKYLNYKWKVYLDNFNSYPELNSINMNIINSNLNIIGLLDGFMINKDVIIQELDRTTDYIKKQLILDKKVILVDVASVKNIILVRNIIDSEDVISIRNVSETFNLNNDIIDDVTLKNNYIVFLKNQTVSSENGIYLYNNLKLTKQIYNIDNLENIYFSIIYGKINKNTYWRINKDTDNNQKIYKDNLYISQPIGPLELEDFHQINIRNPYSLKCRIFEEDVSDGAICTSRNPCNYGLPQGCLLLNNKFPVNIQYATTKNIVLEPSTNIISDTCSNDDVNIHTCSKILVDEEINQIVYYKLKDSFIDSHQLKNCDYLLFKNQNNLEENGIYKTISSIPHNFTEILSKYNSYITFMKYIYTKIQSYKSEVTIQNLKDIFIMNDIYNTDDYRKIYFEIMEKESVDYTGINNKFKVAEDLFNYTSSMSLIQLKDKLNYFIIKLRLNVKTQQSDVYWLIKKINIEHNMNLLSCKIREILKDSDLTKNVLTFDKIVFYISKGKINSNKIFKIKKNNNSLIVTHDKFRGGFLVSSSLELLGLKEDVEFKTLGVGELFHGILGMSNFSKQTFKTLFDPKTGKVWEGTDSIVKSVDNNINDLLEKGAERNLTRRDLDSLLNINTYIDTSF